MPVAAKIAPAAPPAPTAPVTPSAPASQPEDLDSRARGVGTAHGALLGFSGIRRTPPPVNEPVRSYAPGTPERAELKARLDSMAAEQIDIPVVVDGREIRTGDTAQIVMPHAHHHVLATWHAATTEHVAQAIEAAERARADWGNWPFEERAGVFLRAAELLSTRWRATLNAATMLGQSKTAFQAEVDAACELADFWRFNVHFAANLYADQPISDKGIWNQTDYRPLEGFIYAVTPFNFTAIGGNLPTAPALMGNTVLWKPSMTAMLSAHYVMQILTEAGLPPGVINFLPGDPVAISNAALSHRDFAGLHFTGSTTVFNMMWKQIGANTANYRTYPRIVGETGGKDFIVAHPSADAQALAVAIVRGGFEYQGQKCSAASRIYVPQSMWSDVR
ncbi:MAG: aldehyde dehydrogenase family protein, partial [Gemmatimonas sp.]